MARLEGLYKIFHCKEASELLNMNWSNAALFN
uniref:Uncharacterized protein n=1 Tax=Anguilla anguilla TaxID=7936 RepID=A0A0E9RYU2_ANGAN